ncbi:sulfotransferase family cytosolic 1B member 1-like [Stegodyphus dumicola]|uniref:sulfotransferase family cytosolic 1B member 1-like n=1 Tax=Stegodyphus dumicola TaxID=202533 RepID=UPI0015B01F1D|nr:sulfotransferase family cytosolic 1B member 1-like [Stegodyphus dumicola]XP_035217589.1 sulfotransferase family cytosolic 1B member 1-like [Stegodyphus dumicola]XP_035217590.1 sulfotransferase family cytosolic 1B member 1-like [Stegodyphus dumicola]
MLSLKFLYNSPLGSFVTGWRKKKREGKSGKEIVLADQDPTLDMDPLRAAYIRSIPRAQWFKGVLLQGYLVHPNILQGLDDFEVRDDDVFIITYPKSGTTWTEEIVSLIYNDGNPNKVKNKLLNYRVEHLEVGRPIGHMRHLRKLKSPRLMATHLPLPLIPKQLRQGKCKIIYVVRNPKDNAVSYYHHHRMSTFLGNYKGSWDDFLHLFMKGYLVYGSWFDHVLPYWRFCQEHPDRMLFISFEQLKLDLPGMVSKIAFFLGRPLSPEAIEAISNHCTFEQMKSNNMVNREVLPISDLFDMTQSKFMRKGIIGDWKNYFTEEQNAIFNKLYNEKMQNSNLELIFHPDEIDNQNNNDNETTKSLDKPMVMQNGNINNAAEHAT